MPLPQETEQLSSSLEDYLEAIFIIKQKHGIVRSTAVATRLGVARSSVTVALKALAAKGLVIYEPYKPIRLTDTGKDIGKKVVHRHIILKDFFQNVLGLSTEKANEIACRAEHAIDDDTVMQLGRFILFLRGTDCPIDDWQNLWHLTPRMHSLPKALTSNENE